VRREGRAAYPRRRVGMVFDREEISIADVPSQEMSFWCADVAALPFADASFTCALSLNVVDCVSQPLGHLAELGRVLAPSAPAVLTTPYDWSPTATPVEQWLGGHSQRSEHGGSSAAEMRRILSPDAAAGIDTGLLITGERDDVRWRIPANERSHVEYDVHLLRLRRKP
jgi:SAM-dependent methyltransferase